MKTAFTTAGAGGENECTDAEHRRRVGDGGGAGGCRVRCAKRTDETAARDAVGRSTLDAQRASMEVLSAEPSAEREAADVAKKSIQQQTNLQSKLGEFLFAIQEPERQLDAKDDETTRLNAELATSS